VVSRVLCVALVLAAGVAGCGGGDQPPVAPPATAGRLLTDAPRVSALAVTADGKLLAGALQTGEIAAFPPTAGRSLPRLRVATGGQRGLLGLAAGSGGRVYAAYTRAADRRIVVDRIAPGARRRIWTGPRSTTLANGGHLALAPDGRLVIGIGDLQDAARTPDPRAPNGKLLALDPAGHNRRPTVLSSGWNNPYAFAFTPDGALWVADNSPGKRAERLARGDRGGAPADVSDLGRKTAPSGIAALSGSELAVCGFVSGMLDRYRRATSGRWRFAGTIARGCRYGVVLLPRERLAFSTGSEIRTVAAR
jgi:hypothetical protein